MIINKFDLQPQIKNKWRDWSKGELIDFLVTCVFCKHQYIAISVEPGEFSDCPKCHKGINDWSEETKLAVNQIVLQHLLSLEPSYKNLESIINPDYDHEKFKQYVENYKKMKKKFEDIKISLNAFIPLVPDNLYYRITEIEVLILQISELLEEMVSFLNKNTKDLTDLTKNTIKKLEKSVKKLNEEVGF